MDYKAMKFDFSDLVEQGLVKQKTYPNGLSIFKYAGKVFYDSRWNEDERLLMARGIVLDPSGEVVIYPFTKVFNHHENGTELDPDVLVIAPRKVNGFLASVSSYNGEMIIATTGTLDSEYVALAREYLDVPSIRSVVTNLTTDVNTLLFEICHPSDPHIVDEKYGAWLIGGRNHETGQMFLEQHLDSIAKDTAMLRPEWFRLKFGDLVKLSRTVDHEGFMVRLLDGTTVMKIKSPHYLSKKALMRLGDRKLDGVFKNPSEFIKRLDEEFYDCFDAIFENGEEFWKGKTEAERKAWLEEFFKEGT